MAMIIWKPFTRDSEESLEFSLDIRMRGLSDDRIQTGAGGVYFKAGV